MTSPSRPSISGIHHLKFPVTNLETSLNWYTTVLGASRIAALDHFNSNGERYAIVLSLPALSGPNLELRLNPDQAKNQEMFDPVTLAVETKADLDAWGEFLDKHGVAHSPVLTGVVGWVLVFEVCLNYSFNMNRALTQVFLGSGSSIPPSIHSRDASED